MKSKLPEGWRIDRSQGYLQYVRTDGARVYQQRRPAWGTAIWCAHAPGWDCGSPVSSTRAGAFDYVARHYPLS